MNLHTAPCIPQAQVEAKKEHEGAVHLLEVSVGDGLTVWDWFPHYFLTFVLLFKMFLDSTVKFNSVKRCLRE